MKGMAKRRIFKYSVFLSLIIILLSSVIPADVIALETTNSGINPPLSVINSKIETVAKEKEIPSIILKAIAFRESEWRQWDSEGNPLLSNSDHPAIGIMQVATYDENDTAKIDRLENDIDYNLSVGADLLNEKWNMTPTIGDGDRNKLENWYYAIWAYNYWIKDGNSKNNPHQVAPGQLTYQDSVLNLCATDFIPEVPGAITPVTITKPSLQDIPETGTPVSIATPQPVHYGDLDTAEVPSNSDTANSADQKDQQTSVSGQNTSGIDGSYIPDRYFGKDRIETAIAIAQAGWQYNSVSKTSQTNQTGQTNQTESIRRVILARSDNFADALSGVPLAAKYDAPVLLTPVHRLDDRVLAEIKRENPDQIILLGSEGALGPEIKQSLLEAGFEESQIQRIQGQNRYETAANIALEAGAAANGTVYIVKGENFPDALGAAAIAGQEGFPILLMPTDRIAEETIDALKVLKPATINLIGFTDEVYLKTKTALLQAFPNVQIIPIRGKDRYATTVRVVKTMTVSPSEIYIATGENFPDALAGAAFAAHRKAILLLVPDTRLDLHQELIDYLQNAGPAVQKLGAFGSSEVVKNNILTNIRDIIAK